MQEARQILQQRVNAYGVAESTVVIQGDDQIVISIPGKSASDISNIGAAAKLNFRPVVMPPVTLPERRDIRLGHRQPVRGHDHAGADSNHVRAASEWQRDQVRAGQRGPPAGGAVDDAVLAGYDLAS